MNLFPSVGKFSFWLMLLSLLCARLKTLSSHPLVLEIKLVRERKEKQGAEAEKGDERWIPAAITAHAPDPAPSYQF